MKNLRRHSLRVTSVLLLPLLMTACATGGGGNGPTDKLAAEKAKAYVDGMSFVVAGTAGGICAPPTVSQKSALSSTEGPSKEWKDLLQKASACAGDKNWKTLDQVAETMARTDINAPWGAYFMSVSAEGRSEWQRALWMIELAQKKAGLPNGLFLYQHGRVMLGMKETAHAMSDVQKAVSLEPKLTLGHLFLAQIYQRDLEWDQAASHYIAVLTSDERNVIALAGLADVRFNQGKHQESADLYSKAISWNSSHLEWWLRLGSLYETNLKNNELALNTFKGLRSSLDKGVVKQHPSLDLNAKIKTLEDQIVSARQPASKAKSGATLKATPSATEQASALKPDQNRSKK
jgi:tetratricopeptide (TPR) repeat protein